MPSQPDAYLDDDELAGDDAPLAGTPREMLRQIAANPKTPASARVAALKALDDRDPGETSADPAMLEIVRQVADLSTEQLDKELAGFMDGGHVPPPPPPPGSEADIEQRVRRRVRAWAKSQGVSLTRQAPEPRQAPAEPERVAAETAPAPQQENVVPLSAVEKRRMARGAAARRPVGRAHPAVPRGRGPKAVGVVGRRLRRRVATG